MAREPTEKQRSFKLKVVITIFQETHKIAIYSADDLAHKKLEVSKPRAMHVHKHRIRTLHSPYSQINCS